MKSAEIKSLMKIPESYQLLGFVTAGIEGKASSIKKNVPKKEDNSLWILQQINQ